MKNISDNLSALIYLKNKLHKWKNITIFLLVICLMLLVRVLFGDLLIRVVDGNYIANIKIAGEILEDDYRSEILTKVALDNNIKAVIFNINSPGGEIVASEILYSEIRAIAQIKPTIVVVGSVAASGAYMAAIGADHIIAHNASIIGSIGVLLQSFEITELARKVGVKLQNYKSSPLKAVPSPFEKSSKLSDEVVQSSINDSYQFFTDLVYSRRKDKLDKNNLKMIVDGRIFSGRQALKLGLIDEIGSKGNALIYLKNFYKIAIEKLPIREVETKKTDNRFFNKFFSFIPFYNQSKFLGQNNQRLMAIMKS
jgi:protease-4